MHKSIKQLATISAIVLTNVGAANAERPVFQPKGELDIAVAHELMQKAPEKFADPDYVVESLTPTRNYDGQFSRIPGTNQLWMTQYKDHLGPVQVYGLCGDASINVGKDCRLEAHFIDKHSYGQVGNGDKLVVNVKGHDCEGFVPKAGCEEYVDLDLVITYGLQDGRVVNWTGINGTVSKDVLARNKRTKKLESRYERSFYTDDEYYGNDGKNAPNIALIVLDEGSKMTFATDVLSAIGCRLNTDQCYESSSNKDEQK
ncbi:MAG: hypothetical protein AABX70_07105 [Nanoarchaeota archaeon]